MQKLSKLEWQQDYAANPEYQELRIKQAKAAGFEVIVGDDCRLLLDLDGGLGQCRSFLPLIDRIWGIQREAYWRSHTVGHWHAVITLLNTAPILDRIMAQLVLGSDPIREKAALSCYDNGVKEPLLLFARPDRKVYTNIAKAAAQDDIPYG